MSITSIVKTLSNKETWDVSDVLHLLCGSLKVHEAEAIILCESRHPLGGLMEIAAANGRFGSITIYTEPGSGCTPSWDCELLHEPFDQHFVDETLEMILDLPIHPLRVIEWIDDEFEYDKASSSLTLESKKFTLNPQAFEMFREWRARRDKGGIKDPVAEVSFEKLVKADLWVKTEVHVALFGETYPQRYPSFIYHHYKPELEECLKTVDTYIEGALATGKLRLYPHRGSTSLLIDNQGYDEYHGLKDLHDIGIYTSGEIKGKNGIIPKDALEILKFKGYPVPEGLIEAIYEGKWEKAEKLCKKLREGFLYFVEYGELPSADIEASKKEKEFFPAPEGTKWKEIMIVITKEGSIKIIIKNKEQLFHLNKFITLIPSRTSRELLLKIIQAGGIFDRSIFDPKTQEYFKQYISKLRKELKELFGVHENPIEMKGEGEYKINFKISNLLSSPKS